MSVEKPLDLLARNSLAPEIALNNGKPTLIEFYADWCEVCKEMAPDMLIFKKEYENEIDVVMLNVDNEKWLDLIKKYEVIGIPHISLFDEYAINKGNLIGLKSKLELKETADFILGKIENLNLLNKNQIDTKNLEISPIKNVIDIKPILPMSHS